MATQLDTQKTELRNHIQAALKAISPAALATASAQTCMRLKQQKPWKEAGVVLFFAPLSEELDLWALLMEKLAEGRTVALPRFEARTQAYVAARIQDLPADICTGRFHIREPLARCVEIPMDRLDFVLVPGVAFDLRGRRLGRGRGYYDRLLTGVRGLKCGVAFDEQIVAEVPVADHDVCMDFIVTPTRWVRMPD